MVLSTLIRILQLDPAHEDLIESLPCGKPTTSSVPSKNRGGEVSIPQVRFGQLFSGVAMANKPKKAIFETFPGMRNTPSIIFSDLLESALHLEIGSIYKVFRERCL